MADCKEIEQKATEVKTRLLQDMSDGEWFELQEKLLVLERRLDVQQIMKR